MIYAITPENRALCPSFVEQQFQIRHAIFVKEKGWKEFGRRSTYEMDQYDDEEAIYILAAEGDRVIADFRLYPTTRPHMLLNAFPSLSKAKSRRLLTFWNGRAFLSCGTSATAAYITSSAQPCMNSASPGASRPALQLSKCRDWLSCDMPDLPCGRLAFPRTSAASPSSQSTSKFGRTPWRRFAASEIFRAR
jgi:hypothetical protein